ncbi:MAG: hypothetical protein M3Q71_10280 [Chloroflexota bacterium]|nr:hypothetical protein [Chloroflexota bacterium]MDP9471038.1 hypothetical protein [Chloroflexota bacterium]
MKPERCQAITKSGSPCGATPVPGAPLCAWHSPAWAEKRREWSRKGGAGRSNQVRAKKRLPAEALTLQEVQGLLGVAFKGVLAGRLEPNIGTALASIAKSMVAVAGAAEVEEQIAELRQMIDGRVS